VSASNTCGFTDAQDGDEAVAAAEALLQFAFEALEHVRELRLHDVGAGVGHIDPGGGVDGPIHGPQGDL
jgi:hypothetical protein